MATPTGSFRDSSGNQFLVEHGGAGLTFTHFGSNKPDARGFRFRVPWEEFNRFIVACYKASIYNTIGGPDVHLIPWDPEDPELYEASKNYVFDPERPDL